MPPSATGVNSTPSHRPSLPRTSTANPPSSQTPQDAQFDKELEEIRRYEDFTTIGIPLIILLTIDWVQDAARERYRRRQNLRESRKRRNATWSKRILYRLMDAGQPWVVITLIGTRALPLVRGHG